MGTHEKINGDLRAAKYLHVSRTTIHRLKKSGRIAFTQIGGRFFYSQSDLDNIFYHPMKEVSNE